MKRVILCLDGTWNTDAPGSTATNVLKLHEAIAKFDTSGIQQQSHYVRGIASTQGESAQFVKGALGFGVSDRIGEAYGLLCKAYEPGDEIYIFGFSRGAFEARSLAGFIDQLGVAKRGGAFSFEKAWTVYRQPEAKRDRAALTELRAASHFPIRIKCVGVWDTVGNIGNPFFSGGRIGRKYAFHNTRLPDAVEVGLHALSIDEIRGPFRTTFWTLPKGEELPKHQRIEQVWFAGTHADVGGGFRETALSDIALRWMTERTSAMTGLAFDMDRLQRTARPDPLGPQHVSAAGSIFKWSALIPFIRLIKQSADAIPQFRRTLIGSWRSGKVPAGEMVVNESIHDSVLQRFGQRVNEMRAGRSHLITYRPQNLAAVVRETETLATPTPHPGKPKRVKVFTVHGTFAHETEWDNWFPEKWSAKDESDEKAELGFITKLSRHLHKQGVIFEEADHTQYNWSGGNSHDERRVSAIGLKKLIESDLTEQTKRHGKDYYDGGVYVIGHSHGGTISRLAMNLWDKDDQYHDPDPAEFAHDDKCQHCMQGRNGEVGPNTVPKPNGVITFGSPFVSFETRKGGLRTAKFGVGLFRFLALLVVGVATLLWYLLLKAGGDAFATAGLQAAGTETAWLLIWPLAWGWLLGLWLPRVVRKRSRRWFGDSPLRLAVGAAMTAVRVGVLAALAVYYATLLLGGDLAGGWQRVIELPLLRDEALRHKLWWAVPFIYFWMIAISIPGRILAWMNDKVEGLRDKLPKKYDPPEGRPVSYLSYHTIGDEAGLGLRIQGFLTWLIQTLSQSASSVLFYGSALVPIVAIGYLLVCAIGFGSPEASSNAFVTWAQNVYGTATDGKPRPEALDPIIRFMDWLTFYPAAVWSWLWPHLGGTEELRLNLSDYGAEKYDLVWKMPGAIIGAVFQIFLGLMPTILLAILAAHVVSNWLRNSFVGFGAEKLSWTLANRISISRRPNENTMMRVFNFSPEAWAQGEPAHCCYYKNDGVIEDVAGFIADWNKFTPTPPWPIGKWIATLARWLVVTLFVLSIFALAVYQATYVPTVTDLTKIVTPDQISPSVDPGTSGDTKAVTPEPVAPNVDPGTPDPTKAVTPEPASPAVEPKKPEEVIETPAAPSVP